MDNPYSAQQTTIITRILSTVEKLNESMLELNRAVEQTNVYNSATAEVVELWTQYLNNVRFNLSSQKAKDGDATDGRTP
ncbi:hypothetical protein RQP46_006441 [Phenoliferia psychrophenolica]